MKIIKNLSVALLLTVPIVSSSYAEIAVITNVGNESSLDKTQIKNIYLGKLKTFPNGEKVIPLDITTGDNARADFLEHVLGKSESNINSYWARMVFSSKGKPPRELDNSEEVIKFILGNKSAIGYVDSTKVNDSVRVLLKVK